MYHQWFYYTLNISPLFLLKQKKKVEESQASQAKKNLPEKEVVKKDLEKKDEELSVSLLKIQIGHIRKAWKHPSADRCGDCTHKLKMPLAILRVVLHMSDGFICCIQSVKSMKNRIVVLMDL